MFHHQPELFMGRESELGKYCSSAFEKESVVAESGKSAHMRG